MIRDFVRDGASTWFIGKCNGERAEEILNEKYRQTGDDYYAIRSVSIDKEKLSGYTYVFALSYIRSGITSHLRIFKDKKDSLCVIQEDGNMRNFSNIAQIIDSVVQNAKPIPDPRFKEFVLPKNEDILPMNDNPSYVHFPLVTIHTPANV